MEFDIIRYNIIAAMQCKQVNSMNLFTSLASAMPTCTCTCTMAFHISYFALVRVYIYINNYCCRFMYPQHMLSQHFLTEGKKAELAAAAAEVRGQNLKKLLGDHLQDNSEQWRQLKACLNAVRGHTEFYIVSCDDKMKEIVMSS